ncbi:hypothetical protein H0H93_013809 [Arthromyces matolae]|nr:hypothetical protein H0H93_013809 [Arthromyces matolae]
MSASKPSTHGGARSGAGRKPKVAAAKPHLFTGSLVVLGVGNSKSASAFFAKQTHVDGQVSDSVPIPGQHPFNCDQYLEGFAPLSPTEYAQLRSEWENVKDLRNEEGNGNANVEESVFDDDFDDLLAAMNEAEREVNKEDPGLKGVHKDYLRTIVKKLKSEIKTSGIPNCYQKGSF